MDDTKIYIPINSDKGFQVQLYSCERKEQPILIFRYWFFDSIRKKKICNMLKECGIIVVSLVDWECSGVLLEATIAVLFVEGSYCLWKYRVARENLYVFNSTKIPTMLQFWMQNGLKVYKDYRLDRKQQFCFAINYLKDKYRNSVRITLD